MSATMAENFVSIRKAGQLTGISPARIYYWLKRDPNFPRGVNKITGKEGVCPSAVREYFARLSEYEEVSGPLGESGEYDEASTQEE